MVSIITPWRNHPELLPAYAAAVGTFADVAIVDNSDDENAQLAAACLAHRWTHLPGAPAMSFAESNNYGFRHTRADIVLFLNNDIEAPAGWLAQVERDVKPGGLYGPSRLPYQIDAQQFVYLEGWCLAATRDTWMDLGGWDQAYPGGYWEDTDLCWRALQLGLTLHKTSWPVKHLGNTTAKDTPGAYAHSQPNYERFAARVREARRLENFYQPVKVVRP